MARNSTDSSALCTSLSFCIDDVGKNALFSCLFASNRWNVFPYLTSNAKLCIIIIRQRCIDVNASLRIKPPVYRRQCMAARPVYLEGHGSRLILLIVQVDNTHNLLQLAHSLPWWWLALSIYFSPTPDPSQWFGEIDLVADSVRAWWDWWVSVHEKKSGTGLVGSSFWLKTQWEKNLAMARLISDQKLGSQWFCRLCGMDWCITV